VLRLAEQNNNDVAAARRGVEASQQGIKVANAAKLPDINASLSLSYIGDATILDRNFSNITRAATPHFGNTLEVSVYQPVYTGGAITAGVDLAQSEAKISNTKLDITRQSVSIQAIGCFLELTKARNLLSVYDENIAITKRLLDEMNARYNQGIVLKNDITRYELRLTTLNYDRLTIANRIEVLNNDLCTLLGIKAGTRIGADSDALLSVMPEIRSKEAWLNETYANSNSLKMVDTEHEINSHKMKLLKADRLPKIGLVAGDTFDGPITFEIPPINKNLNIWFVGVNVKYNLSSLFKTSKSERRNTIERAEIEQRRQATIDALDRTIDNNYTQFTQAFQMLETEEKSVELATENYRIVENRYNNQLALLTDMLDASTAKLDADVRLVNARINIIYYYYQLKYNSGTL
jgi:outer membrane protein TolC